MFLAGWCLGFCLVRADTLFCKLIFTILDAEIISAIPNGHPSWKTFILAFGNLPVQNTIRGNPSFKDAGYGTVFSIDPFNNGEPLAKSRFEFGSQRDHDTVFLRFLPMSSFLLPLLFPQLACVVLFLPLKAVDTIAQQLVGTSACSKWGEGKWRIGYWGCSLHSGEQRSSFQT